MALCYREKVIFDITKSFQMKRVKQLRNFIAAAQSSLVEREFHEYFKRSVPYGETILHQESRQERRQNSVTLSFSHVS
jgi:hypothetical protein